MSASVSAIRFLSVSTSAYVSAILIFSVSASASVSAVLNLKRVCVCVCVRRHGATRLSADTDEILSTLENFELQIGTEIK